MDNRKKLSRDLVLIALLLAAAAALYFFFGRSQEEGQWAVVRVDGQEVARYPMERDGVYTLNGGTNVIEIRDGCVWMSEADCPDHICVKMGKKHLANQVITCLPNLLTVTVEGGDDMGLDVIAG